MVAQSHVLPTDALKMIVWVRSGTAMVLQLRPPHGNLKAPSTKQKQYTNDRAAASITQIVIRMYAQTCIRKRLLELFCWPRRHSKWLHRSALRQQWRSNILKSHSTKVLEDVMLCASALCLALLCSCIALYIAMRTRSPYGPGHNHWDARATGRWGTCRYATSMSVIAKKTFLILQMCLILFYSTCIVYVV